MRRRTIMVFPTLILLTCGALWAAALPGAPASGAVSASDPAVARPAGPTTPTESAAHAAMPVLAHVSGVSIRQADGGQETVIQVASDHNPRFGVFELSSPSRLVIDLKGARNDSHQWKVSSSAPYLKDVRLGRFGSDDGGVLRVVADLSGHPAFDVHASPAGIEIELRSRENSGNTAKPAVKTEAKAPLETEAVPGRQLEAPPAAKLASEAVSTPSLKSGAVASGGHPAYRTTLPESGSASLAVASVKTDRMADLNPQAETAKTAASVIGHDSVGAAEAAVPGQAGAAGSEATPKYTGEPISVNLKNVDLKDFFRLIHEISGLNILVDPDVNGSVTMVLDSVPWDQALDIVLKDNGLGKQLQGNVLRIAKLSTLQSEQEEAKKLAAAQIDNEPLVTVFRPVNYAKAATLAAMLKGWVGGGALSSRGNVLTDDRTNTLIISDVNERIPLIEDVISKLDQKSAQISIEARIVRVTSDFARTLQSALAFSSINSTGHLINSGSTGSGVGATTATTTSTNGAGGEAITSPVTAASAGGFGVYFLSDKAANYIINGALAAAETRDEAKTISRPSVVTQNNVQATVVQGTQIPVQTTINNTISVQFVQASLQLQVTPQVTHDGNVFLTIQVTNNSPGAVLSVGAAAPSINTQSATTEVLVPDGGTVVFGGVTVTQRTKSVAQVPLLGSIPVVGHLFKNTNTTSNDQELLFFVTPKILRG